MSFVLVLSMLLRIAGIVFTLLVVRDLYRATGQNGATLYRLIGLFTAWAFYIAWYTVARLDAMFDFTPGWSLIRVLADWDVIPLAGIAVTSWGLWGALGASRRHR